MVRVVDAQHHRTVGAQLVHAVERRITRLHARGRAIEELPGDSKRVVSPPSARPPLEDLRLARRDRSQDLPRQEASCRCPARPR